MNNATFRDGTLALRFNGRVNVSLEPDGTVRIFTPSHEVASVLHWAQGLANDNNRNTVLTFSAEETTLTIKPPKGN